MSDHDTDDGLKFQNQIILQGVLARDPKQAGQSGQIAFFTLVTIRDGKYKSYHDCVIWQADKFHQEGFRKGDVVRLLGELRYRRREREDGEVFEAQVVVDKWSSVSEATPESLDFVGGGSGTRKPAAPAPAAPAPAAQQSIEDDGFEDELPF